MARFDQAIPPGGEGEILLTLKTDKYQGTVSKSVVVHTNDPKQPQIKLAVKAHIKVPISFEPRGVMLKGLVGDEIKQEVVIKAHEDQPLTLEPGKLSVPDKAAYELKTIEKGKVYEVVFRNLSKKPDKYSGFLTIKTNYTQKPEITIRFLGYIQGNLECRPETITFVGKEQIPSRRSVTVTLNKGNDLKIEKVEINRELFETKVEQIKAGKNYRIDVKLHPEKLPKGKVNEEMKIYTNLKDEPVTVVPIQFK